MDDFGNDVYDFYGHENYDSASYDSFFNFVIDGLMWDDWRAALQEQLCCDGRRKGRTELRLDEQESLGCAIHRCRTPQGCAHGCGQQEKEVNHGQAQATHSSRIS